jgi:hypothetical protein
LPPLTGDPTKDLAGVSLPPLTGDPTKDLGAPSAVGDQKLHAEYKSGALAKRMQAANARDQANLADEQASTPSVPAQVLQRAAGAVLSDVQAIPGAERAEAALGAAGSHIPGLTPAGGPLDYAQSLAALRGQTAEIPAAARVAGQLATGGLAAAALPAGVFTAISPAASGAIAGGLQGALSADQESMPQRVWETAKDAALGGLVGKALDLGATAVRAKMAPSLGENALARKAALQQASGTAYGQAAIEGQNAVMNQDPALQKLSDALDNPMVKPYADAVRSSAEFADADAPTVAQKAYQLMSERQRTLGARALSDPTNFKAGTSLDLGDIQAAKSALLDGTDAVMPSFRQAIAQHAEMSGENNAFTTGADAAKRALSRTLVPGKKLTQLSPEAVQAQISAMTPAQAQAATEGILGRGGERIGGILPHPTTILNPLTGFGIPRSIAASNAYMQLLRSADQASGSQIAPNIQAIITALANQTAR